MNSNKPLMLGQLRARNRAASAGPHVVHAQLEKEFRLPLSRRCRRRGRFEGGSCG